MAVSPGHTTTEPIATSEILATLERVLSSDAFRKTPSLRQLLQYLVTKSIEGHPEQIKESIIAIDVFGRREDFDGRIDNIVRVQAHRLRKLLDGYYAQEGAADSLRISVPKGTYVPQFDMAAAAVEPPAVEVQPIAASAPVGEAAAAVPRQARPGVWAVALAFLAGSALATLAFQALVLPRAKVEPAIPDAVREIWGPVFENGIRVVASYSNPSFLRVGRLPMLLIYNGPVSAPPGAVIELGANDPNVDSKLVPKGQALHFSESWTGTGEVLAVNRLTLLSTDFHHPLAVMPSRLLSLSEMRSANVIFVGSPSVNGALAQIGLNIRPLYSTPDGHIVIRNPRKGEPQSFSNAANPVTQEWTGSYALFSVVPGIDGARTVVSSAGLNTVSTWAAVDFVTSPAGAAELVRALKAAHGGRMPKHYQAVVHTDIIKGAASNPSLVTIRVID